jgi:hypothetical protein
MDEFQGRPVSRRRLPDLARVPGAGGLQPIDNRPQAFRPFRVTWRRVVTEERLGVGDPRSDPGPVALRVGDRLRPGPSRVRRRDYEVELAAPGESRGTGCIVGRSRWLSGCTG